MTTRRRRSAFGIAEAVILVLTLAAAVYGLHTTWLDSGQAPPWLQAKQEVWV